MKKQILLLSVGLICLSGCSSKFYLKDIPEYGIFFDVSPYEIHDTKNISEEGYFKMHGRYYFDEDKQVKFINFSNSGFEVTFTGTTLEGCFYTTRADDAQNRPYLAVCIDNDYDPDHATPISLTAGKYSSVTRKEGNYFVHEHVVLAHNLENKEHTIRVYKKSECLVSKVGVKSLSTDGAFLPIKAKELGLKLEFYGDSVTCGYAVESPDYYEKFCTRTENSLMTYANYAANKLNADVSLISAGGYPMYKSKYSSGCNPENIPDMFSLADAEYNTQTRHIWNNSSYVPDAVIIALGANDGSMLQDMKNEQEVQDFIAHYKESYKNFINKIHSTYPDALIVVSDEIINVDPMTFQFSRLVKTVCQLENQLK